MRNKIFKVFRVTAFFLPAVYRIVRNCQPALRTRGKENNWACCRRHERTTNRCQYPGSRGTSTGVITDLDGTSTSLFLRSYRLTNILCRL